MSALRRTRLGVSRRDVGAGLVAAGTALLAAVLFNVAILATYYGFDPASVAIYRRQSVLSIVAIAVAPLLAAVVGPLVWRTVVPESPTPRRGAGAGVLTAFGSLFVLAALVGLVAGLGEAVTGSPLTAFGTAVNITVIVLVFGGLLTAVVIAPLGALAGYAYEWALARRRDASLEG